MSSPMYDLPEHATIEIDAEGDGPAEGDAVVGIACWCGTEGCVRHLDHAAVEYCRRLTCHQPIIQPAGRGRPRLYCDDECRRAADRQRKRAVALVTLLERQLERARHEVAAYGREMSSADHQTEVTQ